jgi:hypothetical protein
LETEGGYYMASELRRRGTLVVLLAVALVAASCGSAADGEEAEAADATYIEAVAQIRDEADSRIGDAFDAAFAQAEGRASDSLLPQLSGALETARAALQEALDLYQVLGPPERFAADHERTEQYFEDQIEAWTRQQAAADDGNVELVAEIDLELQSLTRQVLADVSPQFAEYIFAPLDPASASLFSDLDADEADYLDAVVLGMDEFGRRNRAFGAVLERSYSSDQLLLRALLDGGAGEAFASAQAVIVDIEPPATFAAGHARLLEYLVEAVAIDSEIAEAASNGDVVGFEVANYELSLAAARFALEAPPALASIVTGPGQAAPAEDIPGGSFGEGLYVELRVFRALALQVQVGTGVFPSVSEEAIAEALTHVMPTAIGLTEAAITAVEALDPPAQMAGGHERLLVYLNELRLLRQSVLDAAQAIDLGALRSYGGLGGFTAELAETKLWCTTRADLTNDPIEAVTASFFQPFGPVHPDLLCPA